MSKPTPRQQMWAGWIWIAIAGVLAMLKFDSAFVAACVVISHMHWMESYE